MMPWRRSLAGPRSIDGDTIEIRGERIRLYGDTPESSQLCDLDGQPYRCGQQAALALADKIGEKAVRCLEKDVDRYGRTIAVCSVCVEDINRWMNFHGWAIAALRTDVPAALRYYDDT
jgi:endonuclease YncB( thermonuclease family)